MQLLVLLILAMVWAVVLVPPFLRDRDQTRPADSIGAFNRQLAVLGRGRGFGSAVPSVAVSASSVMATSTRVGRTPAHVRKRRRDVLSALLAATAGSLVLGLVPGLGVMLVLALGLGLLTAGYVALLIRVRNTSAVRAANVHHLRITRPSVQPAPIFLRRVAD